MADLASTFSFENAIVSQFLFYATIVLLKMMLMSVWTAKNRIGKEVKCIYSIHASLTCTVKQPLQKVHYFEKCLFAIKLFSMMPKFKISVGMKSPLRRLFFFTKQILTLTYFNSI